jgi:uracil-DNA glycosylase family 4
MQLLLFEKPSSEILIAQLKAEADICKACPLYQGAKQAVFSDGPITAKVMFVGEAPGENEDEQGIPFVGKSGQLLNRALTAVGINRADSYVTNTCKHRPPDNRTPTLSEAIQCTTRFLAKEIEIIRPMVIVPLGNPAMQFFLGADKGITKTRGNWFDYKGYQVFPTFHPAYVLRNPQRTPGSPADFFWRDLQTIKAKLDAS